MQQQALKTTKALLIHQVSNQELNVLEDMSTMHGYSFSGSSLTLTVHDIKDTDKGAVMGVGRIMSEADKQELKDYLNGEHNIRDCWIPENVMMLNSSQMVWYKPAHKRMMHFKVKGKSHAVELMWPSLIFQATPHGLRVAAYAGKGRPKLDQPLYHAPIWNIYSDGRLCTGSADTTSIISVESMKIWETAIYDTIFTHSNHVNVIAHHTKKQKFAPVSDARYLKFIKAKAKKGEAFKAKDMVPMKRTLQQWAGGQR